MTASPPPADGVASIPHAATLGNTAPPPDAGHSAAHSPGSEIAVPRRRRSHGMLWGWILFALLLWLIVLPRLERQPAIRSHIERNRASGIEPDAMFYTEVGPLQGISLEHRQGRIVVGSVPMSPAPAAGDP